MRRNALISTSGFKKELRFGFSMPKNLYETDFIPKTLFSADFCSFSCRNNAHRLFAWEKWVFPLKFGVNIFFFYFSHPQKAPPCARPDLLVYSAKDSVNRSGLYPDRRTQKKKKKKKMPFRLNMLGIRRTETPKATIVKIGFSGDVPYVVTVVRFCRYRLTGVGVAEPGKVAF